MRMRNGRPPSHKRAIWVTNIMDENNSRLAPGVRAYDVPIPSMINNYFHGVNQYSDDENLKSQCDN